MAEKIVTQARIKQFFEYIREPALQFPLILGMILYIVAVLYIQHTTPRHADPIQSIAEISDRTKQLSSRVITGIHINNFPIFSFHKNDFQIDAVVWFRFPVGSESLETIENFSFQNGEVIRRSAPIIKTHGNYVTVCYQTVARIKTQLSHALFPLSDHRLTIILENRSVTPNEMYFDSNADLFAVAEKPADLMVSTWLPTKKIVRSGYIKSTLSESDRHEVQISYPCIACTIEFTNNSIRDLISLYLPLFMIFFIAFFAMLADVREHALRTTLIGGAVPSLVLFRLVIDNNTPEASNITKVDYLFYILVFLSMVLLLFQVYVFLVDRRTKKLTSRMRDQLFVLLDKLNNILFLFIIIFLTVSFTVTHLFI